MLLRPFLNDHGSCASYLFGCATHDKLAVVGADVEFEHVATLLADMPPRRDEQEPIAASNRSGSVEAIA